MTKIGFCVLILIVQFLTHCDSWAAITGSDEIKSFNSIKYGVSNLTDGNIRTAFCGPNSVKMWLKIPGDNLNGFGIINGYAKSLSTYKDNSRPNILNIKNGFNQVNVKLDDTSYPQWINLEDKNYSYIDVEVKNVYSGNKYTDICVSEIIIDHLIFNLYRDLLISNKTTKEIIYKILNNNQVNREPNSNICYASFKLLTSSYNETSLKRLLDFLVIADSEDHYNSEFNYSLKKLVESFIMEEPNIVLRVMKDKNQLGKSYILDAWTNILGFSAYSSVDDILKDQGVTDSIKHFANEIEKYR